MGKPYLRFVAAIVALVLIAAGCGSSDDSTSTGATADEPATEPAVDAEPDDPESADGAESAVDAEPAESSSELVVSDGWDLVSLGDGIKPSLALDANGEPAIAFLTERQAGGVFYASSADGWAPTTVADGYFYGPIDLAFSPDGVPNVVYHDHQSSGFDPNLGDLTLAVQSADGWELSASGADGHDGWDSTVWFGPNGELWAAGIDPIDFGGTDGVEFYEFDGAAWTVESIGGPAITYEFNVSVATSADGQPVLAYYDNNTDQLHVATRTTDGWVDEAVTEPEGGGMFSSLLIAADGSRHITFFASAGGSNGTVQYAVDDGTGWVIDTVATLDSVALGMFGARRITSLQLAADGSPIVAFTDQSGLWVGTGGTDGWDITTVLTAGERPLGQQVQIVTDDATWHLATFEATSASPLEGDILYLSLTN